MSLKDSREHHREFVKDEHLKNAQMYKKYQRVLF